MLFITVIFCYKFLETSLSILILYMFLLLDFVSVYSPRSEADYPGGQKKTRKVFFAMAMYFAAFAAFGFYISIRYLNNIGPQLLQKLSIITIWLTEGVYFTKFLNLVETPRF